jgi:hypothetical protein
MARVLGPSSIESIRGGEEDTAPAICSRAWKAPMNVAKSSPRSTWRWSGEAEASDLPEGYANAPPPRPEEGRWVGDDQVGASLPMSMSMVVKLSP